MDVNALVAKGLPNEMTPHTGNPLDLCTHTKLEPRILVETRCLGGVSYSGEWGFLPLLSRRRLKSLATRLFHKHTSLRRLAQLSTRECAYDTLHVRLRTFTLALHCFINIPF